MEAFEHFGLWWLPDDDDRAVGGVIRFDPSSGVTLHVAGLVGGLEPFSMSEMIPIILGRIENGKTITLYQCDNVSIRDGIGIDARTFRARAAFVGVWFETEDDIRFSSGTVQFSSLPDWVGNGAFHAEGTNSAESFSYSIRYDRPPELTATTHIGVIRLAYGFSVAADHGRMMSITQRPAFVIEAAEEHSIDSWLEHAVYPLQVFLTFAMRQPASVTDMTVLARAQSTANESERDVFVTVLFEPVFHDSSQPRPVFRHDMLFSLDDVRVQFDTILSRWFALTNELRDVVSRFYSIKFRPNTLLETRFLMVVQAVEAYHRRTGRRQQAIPEREYQERIAAILAGAPEGQQGWLKQKLEFSNEPTLARRLKDLIEDTLPTTASLLGDRKTFVREVVDTRNYHTHYSQELRKKAVSGERLYWITSALTDLFEACLLTKLGFTPQQTHELFASNRRYQHAGQVAV